MRLLKIILLVSLFLLSSSLVLAFNFKEIESYEDFNRNIPALNDYLQDNPIILPPMVLRIVQDEDVAIHVSTEQGHIESFVVSIYQNYITKIIAGPQPTKLYIEIKEKTINKVIENPDLALDYYKQGIIKVKSTNTIKKIKLFTLKTLARWFT